MPDFHIVLQEHLILLHEFNRYAKVLSHRGRYFTYSTKLISHYSEDLIEFVFFLILKRVEVLCLINDSTKYVTVLFVVMKFDVTFKGHNITFGILKEKLLDPLDEDWDTSLSEDLEEGAMPFRNDLRH